MPRFKRPTVRDTGLEKWLGAKKYQEFLYHYNYQKQTYGSIDVSKLAKAMDLSRPTVYHYVTIHEEELEKHEGLRR